MADVTPQKSDEEREDRFRIALGIGTAVMLVLALACCCTGSLLVNATDDGHQTQYRERPHP
jgi:hypothetical protein